MKPKLLIVDDDRLLLEQYVDIVADINADIFLAQSGGEAIEVMAEKGIDILVTDLVLPDFSGEEVIDSARKKDPDTDVIVVTGFATVDSVITMMKKGVFEYIRKPLIPEEFKISLLKCIREREIIEENKKLKEYVSLYELGKLLTGTLELSKIYDNILTVFEKMFGRCAIAVFSPDASSEYEIKAFAGIDRADLIARKTGFIEHILRDGPKAPLSVSRTGDLVFAAGIPHEHALELVFDMEDERQGAIFAFVDSQPEEKLDGLKFIRDQINLAVENSLRYHNAQEMAFLDELTKAYNFRYLHVALDNELRRAERFGTHVSLLFLDLDFFKNVNDQYGHLAGSKLLIEVAGEIKKCVRGIDTVIRYGGDEFIVICSETDTDLAEKVAERIRKRVETTEFLAMDGYSVHITTSIGIATYPVHSQTKTELIDLSDRAMYHGKQISRNVVCVTDKVAGA